MYERGRGVSGKIRAVLWKGSVRKEGREGGMAAAGYGAGTTRRVTDGNTSRVKGVALIGMNKLPDQRSCAVSRWFRIF